MSTVTSGGLGNPAISAMSARGLGRENRKGFVIRRGKAMVYDLPARRA